MLGLRILGILCLLGVGFAGGSVGAAAQGTGKAAPPDAVGAAGWPGVVTKDTGASDQVLDSKQIEAVRKVSGYFNELDNLKGSFVQTDPDLKRIKGKFYVKRPGKFRFDYGAGTKKVVVSDGTYLAIEDRDLNNSDTFELDNTPFRLLLRKDVDLVRDARIIDVQEAEDLIVLTLQDKSPDAPGKIQLFLAKSSPGMALKEWVVTDAQGLQTRVEVSELDKTENLDPNLFKRENLLFKKMQ